MQMIEDACSRALRQFPHEQAKIAKNYVDAVTQYIRDAEELKAGK